MKHSLCFAFIITVGVAGAAASGQAPPSNAPRVPMLADGTPAPYYFSGFVHEDRAHAVARMLLDKPALDFLKQAKTETEAGNLDIAEDLCQKALAAAPIINGVKKPLRQIDRQLGSIYLARGQNKEALAKFQSCGLDYTDPDLRLDMALAAVRAKDYKELQKHYSDQDILNYAPAPDPVLPQDLPGTGTPQMLEASVLLARGLNYRVHGQDEQALTDFLAAAELVPNNVLINGYIAKALYDKGQYAEALPWLEKVVASPRGFIFHDVQGDLHDARIYIQRQQRANQPPGAPSPLSQLPRIPFNHQGNGGRGIAGPAPVAAPAP